MEWIIRTMFFIGGALATIIVDAILANSILNDAINRLEEAKQILLEAKRTRNDQ